MEWNKHIPDHYQKRTKQNWFISNQRMSQELRYSPDRPKVQKDPVNCGNHAAPQCIDCTEGQIWGYAQWCNGQCVWKDGSCRNKLDRVHDTHNRQKEPIGDLGSGLHGQCVLEETGRVQEDTSPFVPDVANMRLELYKAPRLLPLLF